MITAQRANLAYLAFIFLVAALAFPQNVWAVSGNVQICQQGSNCAVGEFLYDDSYTPIATASCTLTSRYPNGDLFINSQLMSSTSAGWYSYAVSATGSAGVYPSSICCTAGSDYLCLDKTFEISTASALTKTDVAESVWNASRSAYNVPGSFGQSLQNTVPSANDIAIAVWGYSDRTLSGFGTLVGDIWGYTNRSLTDFGTLVASIWSNTTRTLTGAGLDSGSLATVEDVKVGTQSATISLSTDIAGVKSDTASIKTTVEQTQTTIGAIYTDTQDIRTNTNTIITKWGSLSAADIFDKISTVSARLGTSNDTSSDSTMFGRIEFIRDKWGTQSAQTIYDQATAAYNTISLVRTDLNYNGKSTTAYEDLQRVIGYVDTLKSLIGTTSDGSSTNTLFGKMKSIQDKVDLLTSIQTDVDAILDKWGSLNASDINTKVQTIKDQLTTVSTTTTFSTLINQTITNNTTITELKNELITMKAIAQVSQTLLEKQVNKPIVKTFLLEGSVIFRSLIINPSSSITQTVPFEYRLPSEVRKEDILEYDKELAIAYDAEKNQYYLTGEFTLAPSETKTVSIRVEDIWKISDKEIASLRKQADELYKPLVNTSYFGQAVTIKSDIDVALDKVLEMQKDGNTPEKKLRVYNEGKIELKGVKTKIDKLKELVALASSAGSLVGFVGGAQAIAVWGLIIIMVAGFVFLALYMRMLQINNGNHNGLFLANEIEASGKKGTKKHLALPHGSDKPLPKLLPRKILRFALILITFGLITAGISGAVVYQLITTRQLEKKSVLGEKSSIQKQKPSAVVLPSSVGDQGQKTQPRIAKIIMPEEGVVTLHKYPLGNAAIVTKVKSAQEVKVLDESTNWVKVNLNLAEETESSYTTGWVNKEFIQFDEKKEISKADAEVKKTAVVNQTPTGFLRVRETPNGAEIGKVTPNDSYPFLQEKNGWVQVELKDGTFGWVSKEYVTISSGI